MEENIVENKSIDSELISNYFAAYGHWVYTKNMLDRAKKEHDLSIEAKNNAENDLLIDMTMKDIPSFQFEDLQVSASYSNKTVINEKLAISLLKERNLLDKFVKITQVNLKKYHLLDIEGIVSVEQMPKLQIKKVE